MYLRLGKQGKMYGSLCSETEPEVNAGGQMWLFFTNVIGLYLLCLQKSARPTFSCMFVFAKRGLDSWCLMLKSYEIISLLFLYKKNKADWQYLFSLEIKLQTPTLSDWHI